MEQIVTYLIMVQKFKVKNSKIVAAPLCLGNISKDWFVYNMKKMDLMALFMNLVLIMMVLQLMILITFINI